MNSWRIQCFVYVAEALNYRKAADALHITQSALTKQIKALEQEVGAILFDRDTTYVRLTDEGWRFYRRVVPILEQMTAADAMFSQGVHVTYSYFYAYGLKEVARRFRDRCPDAVLNMLRLKLWGDTAPVLRQPNSVAYCFEEDVKPLKDGVFVPLTLGRQYMMVAPDNPMAARSSIDLQELDPGSVIIRSGSQLSIRQLDTRGVGLRIENTLGDTYRWVGSNNLNECLEMVRCGCGVAFAPMPLIMDTEPAGIVRVPLEPEDTFSLGIGYLKQNDGPEVRALVDVLVETYGEDGMTPMLA